jgi:Phosphotransferase enzyme family
MRINPVRLANLGPKLSSKAHSEVFEQGDAHVVKLFGRRTPQSEIEEEARITRELHRRGAPVPAVDDGILASDDGRHGLRYERIGGPTLASLFVDAPHRLFMLTRRTIDIHAAIHALDAVEGIRSQHDYLRERVARVGVLSLRERQRLILMLDALPEGNRLCHGNFEMENVIVGADGKAAILSWGQGQNGHPVSDVARTAIILGVPDVDRRKIGGWFELAYRRVLAHIYVRGYFARHPQERRHLREWLAINAAARIEDGVTPDQQARLLGIVKVALGKDV